MVLLLIDYGLDIVRFDLWQGWKMSLMLSHEKTVLIKRTIATLLYLIIALKVAWVVVMIGKI